MHVYMNELTYACVHLSTSFAYVFISFHFFMFIHLFVCLFIHLSISMIRPVW